MPKKQTLALIGAGLLFLLGVATDPFVKGYVRDQVEARDPDVSVGPVEWNLTRVTLKYVQVDKPWAKGGLNVVEVDLGFEGWGVVPKSVRVRGGRLTIDLDQWPKPQGTSSKALSMPLIESVRLDEIRVLRGDYEGVGRDVTLADNKVCCTKAAFILDPESGYALYVKDNRVDAKGVCYDRAQKVVTVKETSATVYPPSSIPGVNPSHDVSALDSKVNLLSKSVHTSQLDVSELMSAQDSVISYFGGNLLFKAKALQTEHPWFKFGRTASRFEDVRLRLPASTSGRASMGVKDSSINVDLDSRHVTGESSCSEWALALPEPKPEALRDPLFLEGNLSFDVEVDSTSAVNLRYSCRAMCNSPTLTQLRSFFHYEAYRPDGKTLFTKHTGPDTEGWVDLGALPTYLPNAVVALEDPSFQQHRGLLTASIKLALEEALERKSFYRGGSTITQQLAKNLWFRRDKTVTRKAAEALMALALESCFTKNQILEIYLNVVEFAPDVYGIGPGVEHYFDKHPSELTPEEAFYLASLLPNPKSALPPNRGGLEWARVNMARLAERGILPEGFITSDQSLDLSGWDPLE